MTQSPYSSSRVIAAPAAEIFELLASPARHSEIDGSGSVQGVQPRTPERLSPGARFGMQMKIVLPYKVLNEVVDFEEGRRISWRHFGGHEWRWVLEPIDDTHTKVTETFDPTTSKFPLGLQIIGAREKNGRSIERTLDRLQQKFSAAAA